MEIKKQNNTSRNLWFKLLLYTSAFIIFDNLINKFILS